MDSEFDLDAWHLPLCVRFCRQSEEFHEIGMDAPVKLSGKMLVLADGKQIVCIHPCDGETTKITEKTRNLVIVGYGAPQIRQT